MTPKPANPKAWLLLRKLQALAERGVDGEKTAAEKKLARLKARYDFAASTADGSPDLFSGKFARATAGRRIYSFRTGELEIANSVKWAIESATKIHCSHSGADLLARATPATARRLTEICDRIAQAFRALLTQFCELRGVTSADRSAFVMGLYDGMMNETRAAGQRLPGRSPFPRKRKTTKRPEAVSAGLHVHPYTVALELGKSIRFSAPLDQITAELEAAAPKLLVQEPR